MIKKLIFLLLMLSLLSCEKHQDDTIAPIPEEEQPTNNNGGMTFEDWGRDSIDIP